MTRTEIINHLIKKNNYTTYLEIGVQNGRNLHAVECKHKVGVDPDLNSKATIHVTSDEFFASNKQKFDIIFIDGLHEAEQVLKDIENSLKALKKGGTIVCHDMNPTTEQMQQVPRIQTEWTGDCWKAWISLRENNSKINMFVVDADYGCGVIRKDKQKKLELLLTSNHYSKSFYGHFNENRKRWLNLISVEEFLKE